MTDAPAALAIAGPVSRPSMTAIVALVASVFGIGTSGLDMLARSQGWIGAQTAAAQVQGVSKEHLDTLWNGRDQVATKADLAALGQDLHSAQQREADARDASDKRQDQDLRAGRDARQQAQAGLDRRVDQLEGKIDDLRDGVAAIQGYLRAQDGVPPMRGRRQSDDAPMAVAPDVIEVGAELRP